MTYPPREDYNTWDVYYLICAGPPLNPALITICDESQMLDDFPHLKEHADEFDWIDKYVGVPENNAPLDLSLYDAQGDFELPNKKLFCPYPAYMQAPREDHKQYTSSIQAVYVWTDLSCKVLPVAATAPWIYSLISGCVASTGCCK